MDLATPDLRGAPAWRRQGWVRTLAAELPGWVAVQPPQPLPAPHWVARNEALAAELGWAGWLAGDDALALLAGNGALAEGPWATAYSGHQFGVWAGALGDGRALLLGEADTPQGPLEVQLKGAGRTPYSRMGDGRAVLRSSIREYLCSEAMHALGIPSTRALALVGSPLPVRRETVETAAVLTRVAPSFLRFGHFEHLAHTAEDPAALSRLVQTTVERGYPELAGAAEPAAALLQAVALRTAALMAQWQAAGFCHGVMNTDNLSILGLTLDYGPFGFLDAFDPGHICNHTDQGGRYAWARQPQVAFWNLHALARALLPLIGDGDAALAAIEPYKAAYADAMLAAWRAKLGLRDLGELRDPDRLREGDRGLADELLRLMAQDRCDYTITFRRLSGFETAPGASTESVRDLFIDRPAFDAWAARYAARLALESSVDAERALRMNRVNPKVVLRNHLAEGAIRRAAAGDFGEVERLLKVLARPYDEASGTAADAGFPPDWAQHLEVSCSS